MSTGKGRPPKLARKIKSHFTLDQFQSRLEWLAVLGLETSQRFGLARCEQRFGRSDTDLLAGDHLPDDELASLLPAAATVGSRQLVDFGGTPWTIPKAGGRSDDGILRPAFCGTLPRALAAGPFPFDFARLLLWGRSRHFRHFASAG